MSRYVRVGSVRRFDHVEPSRAQALKVCDEASDVFGAWQRLNEELVFYKNPMEEIGNPCVRYASEDLLDECADVIQATCNLIAAMRVEDFAPYMEACRKRNEERGRM